GHVTGVQTCALPILAQVKLVVAYDGTDFSGFARQPGQPGVRTVGGVLAQAIGKILRHDIEVACAGRTDSGVHAWGQVVSFPSERSEERRVGKEGRAG